MRICGVDAEDIADMIAEIRELNPKPGLAFDRSRCSRSCPTSCPLPDGTWQVELNSDTLPRVLVNALLRAK